MSNDKQPDETPTGTQREFREYARGQLDVDHLDVHPIAGLGIPEKKRQALMFAADVYEPPTLPNGQIVDGFPRSFWDTSFARRAIRKHTTDAATTAVREDNVSQLATMVGDPSHESDISGLHEIEDLEQWLVNSEDCMLIYIASLMGRGKTDFASLLYELIWSHHRRIREEIEDYDTVPELAANFHLDPTDSDADVDLINDYDTLREDFMETGSSSDEKWFIFDEASSELTAQNAANAQKVVENMGSMIKKMRKHGVNLIVIGHDRQDVHVAIRSMCKYVDKTSKKKARIYEGIQQREPHNLQMEVSGIPPTSWEFDTDDTAVWSWGSGVEDDEPQMDPEDVRDQVEDTLLTQAAKAYLDYDSLTQQDAADMFSTEEINLYRQKISDRVDEVEDIRQMQQQANNNNGVPADD